MSENKPAVRNLPSYDQLVAGDLDLKNQQNEVREGQEVRERLAKINDHLLDALSYLIVSLPERIEPQIDIDETELPPDDTKLLSENGFY